ncbi:MAG: tetratricopeptide repeat protein [Chloroflexi bacterium]|nr:tetratricopeptide repeat protein [Chloroflexota bacterium]
MIRRGSPRQTLCWILAAWLLLILPAAAAPFLGLPAAVARADSDSVSLLNFLPDFGNGIIPGETYRVQSEVGYSLGSKASAYLVLYLFEDEDERPAVRSRPALQIAEGTGRATLELSYTVPRDGVSSLQLIVVMLQDANTILAWRASRMITLAPPSGYGLFQEGLDAYKAKDYQRAIAWFSDAIREGPKVPQYYQWRADALARLRDYKEALADLTQALELMPDDPSILANLGIVNLWLSDWNSAVDDLTVIIEQLDAPDDLKARAYRGRGIAYASLGDASAAIYDFRAYMTYYPEQASDVAEWIANLGG